MTKKLELGVAATRRRCRVARAHGLPTGRAPLSGTVVAWSPSLDEAINANCCSVTKGKLQLLTLQLFVRNSAENETQDIFLGFLSRCCGNARRQQDPQLQRKLC